MFFKFFLSYNKWRHQPITRILLLKLMSTGMVMRVSSRQCQWSKNLTIFVYYEKFQFWDLIFVPVVLHIKYLGSSYTEAIPPVAISPKNKAIYHLWTKQIYLYRTSHTGAMRYSIKWYIALLLGDIAAGDIASVWQPSYIDILQCLLAGSRTEAISPVAITAQ